MKYLYVKPAQQCWGHIHSAIHGGYFALSHCHQSTRTLFLPQFILIHRGSTAEIPNNSQKTPLNYLLHLASWWIPICTSVVLLGMYYYTYYSSIFQNAVLDSLHLNHPQQSKEWCPDTCVWSKHTRDGFAHQHVGPTPAQSQCQPLHQGHYFGQWFSRW